MGRPILMKEDLIMSELEVGGYTVHSEIGESELAIFNAAMKNHYGVDFKPVAVASQIVNGTNYAFICVGKPVVAHPIASLYVINIYTHFAHSVAPTIEVKSIEELDIKKLI
jgi:hypothetical protein